MAIMNDFDKDWASFMADFNRAEVPISFYASRYKFGCSKEEQIAYLHLYRQMTSKQEGCAKNVKHLAYVFKQLRKDLKRFKLISIQKLKT